MGFSQGSAFGINGCKVADGGREDSNGVLIGFSLLGVSGEVSCGYLVVCGASTGDPAQHHFVSGCSTFAFILLWFKLESSVRYLRVCFMEIGELGCRLALEVGVFGNSM